MSVSCSKTSTLLLTMLRMTLSRYSVNDQVLFHIQKIFYRAPCINKLQAAPFFEYPPILTHSVSIQLSCHLMIYHQPIPIIYCWDPVSITAVWFLESLFWIIPCVYFDFLWETLRVRTDISPCVTYGGFGFGRPLVGDSRPHLLDISWYLLSFYSMF